MKSGYTIVLLLFIMLLTITVTTASVMVIVSNSAASNKYQQGVIAYQIAESGLEDVLITLLRNPGFTGETLTVGDGTATITVSGTNPQTITSVGQTGGFSRTVSAVITRSGGTMAVTSWKEIYP